MSLNTRERRLDREEKKRKENEPPPLNPPFPYKPTEFDPTAFPGVLSDPPVDKETKL